MQGQRWTPNSCRPLDGTRPRLEAVFEVTRLAVEVDLPRYRSVMSVSFPMSYPWRGVGPERRAAVRLTYSQMHPRFQDFGPRVQQWNEWDVNWKPPNASKNHENWKFLYSNLLSDQNDPLVGGSRKFQECLKINVFVSPSNHNVLVGAPKNFSSNFLLNLEIELILSKCAVFGRVLHSQCKKRWFSNKMAQESQFSIFLLLFVSPDRKNMCGACRKNFD